MSSDREFCAKVATKVMGWKPFSCESSIRHGICSWVDGDGRGGVIFKPDTDPAADYAVLCKVREEWDDEMPGPFDDDYVPGAESRIDMFFDSLGKLLCNESGDGDWNAGYIDLMRHYKPGFYARAALAVVEAKEKMP